MYCAKWVNDSKCDSWKPIASSEIRPILWHKNTNIANEYAIRTLFSMWQNFVQIQHLISPERAYAFENDQKLINLEHFNCWIFSIERDRRGKQKARGSISLVEKKKRNYYELFRSTNCYPIFRHIIVTHHAASFKKCPYYFNLSEAFDTISFFFTIRRRINDYSFFLPSSDRKQLVWGNIAIFYFIPFSSVRQCNFQSRH